MLYNIHYSDGTSAQVTSDTVVVQAVNADATIIYRFDNITVNPPNPEGVSTTTTQTVAFVSGDTKMQIIGMT